MFKRDSIRILKLIKTLKENTVRDEASLIRIETYIISPAYQKANAKTPNTVS